ncbi:MAG TPA: type II toxin-antitoxin system ParD family antitoxin [Tepidisphaeraceae bacterium]|nr:type II toxin-antitoxin system ParD family antitoxin [Tepidisphaeraceae bacterium]
MPTQNVNLSEKQATFIRKHVDNGQYGNASEVVRAGLRLLEQQEQENDLKLRALRQIARQGFNQINQGECDSVDPTNLDQFLNQLGGKTKKERS